MDSGLAATPVKFPTLVDIMDQTSLNLTLAHLLDTTLGELEQLDSVYRDRLFRAENSVGDFIKDDSFMTMCLQGSELRPKIIEFHKDVAKK